MPGLAPVAPVRRTMSVAALVSLILVGGLALLVGILKPLPPGDAAFMAGERVGTLFVLLVFPLLLAWIIAGRRSVWHPNRFALIFCIVAGVFTLGNGFTMFSEEPPDQRFPRLMREAAGIAPESHRGFGRQRRLDDQVRNQYRKLLQQNRDYRAAVDQLDIGKIKDLNSPLSFANPELEKEGLQQLHAVYDADADQERKVREIMQDLRQILESNAGSAGEREGMLRGFDNSTTAQFSKRQEAISAEKEWVDAVDDLHSYVNAHRSDIVASGSNVVIPDATVRNQFNAKVQLQETRRLDFLKLQQQLSQSQAESLRKMGLQGKDVGGK
jgi:hypothetical protein